jgi:hypothetical protein
MAGGELRDSGRKAGFWLEEFAAPYYVFKDVLASFLCIIIDQVPQVDRAVNTVHRHSTLPGFEHCDSRLHIDTSKRHQRGRTFLQLSRPDRIAIAAFIAGIIGSCWNAFRTETAFS